MTPHEKNPAPPADPTPGSEAPFTIAQNENLRANENTKTDSAAPPNATPDSGVGSEITDGTAG